MAFWNRKEQRSALSGLQYPQEWLPGSLGASPNASGQKVTVRNALGVSPVWSAVSMIAEQVGQLPLNVYKLVDDDRVEARTHRAWRLLHDQPNEYTPADRFWSTTTVHLLLYGNAFIRKHRDSLGLVDELVLMNPALITVYWDGDQRIKQFNYQPPNGQRQTLGPEDVIHIYGLSTDGVIGESVINRCKNSFGAAMARDIYEGSFYKRGATLSAAIEMDGQIKGDAALKRLKDSVNALFSGADKAHGVGVFENGAKLKTVGSPMKDLQFVESQQLSRTDIAVMFKLPANYLGGSSGDSLTYATVESNQIQFALHAIAPWTNTIAKALAADPGIFPQNVYDAEFDMDKMLRADAGARGTYYTQMSAIKAMTRNEIRRREGLPPLPDGDSFEPPEKVTVSGPAALGMASPTELSATATPAAIKASIPVNGNSNGVPPTGAPNGS